MFRVTRAAVVAVALSLLLSEAGAADRILGTTNGAGTAEELTPEQAADLIGVGLGLQENHARGPEITGANCSNPLIVGNGTQKGKLCGDATKGFVIEPVPLGDTAWRCFTNFNCIIRDEEGNATVLAIDPDAASKNAMYQFGANYKPLGSFPVGLEPRGAATVASESILTNHPKAWWVTLTDANTDAVDFHFFVTAKMAGATTATVRLVGVSKNASPSGSIELDCAMTTYNPGGETFGAHSTAGEVSALLTPAVQNRPVAVTTASHTINGGPLTAGEIVFGSCEVDAAATTSAQMSDFRVLGQAVIQLSVNSWSD